MGVCWPHIIIIIHHRHLLLTLLNCSGDPDSLSTSDCTANFEVDTKWRGCYYCLVHISLSLSLTHTHTHTLTRIPCNLLDQLPPPSKGKRRLRRRIALHCIALHRILLSSSSSSLKMALVSTGPAKAINK